MAREQIDRAISVIDERGEGSEIEAACALIRRKRLGPYRRPADRPEFRQKDLAAMARAGFAIGLAQRLLRASDVAALEQMARGEEP